MDTPLLELTAEGTPRSARYDDVYFSREGGLAESRYVFLEHNGLRERFSRLAANQTFSIAETGFGTGLNFLATWQWFDQYAPADARLLFISTEKYPLASNEIEASLNHWPELAPYLKALIESYPPRFEGFHCLELTERVELLLLFGDANDTLPELSASIDAWFLDGFAPAKNPELWQPALFQAMSRLSHQDTTAATFTAARLVRDGLQGAGFLVERVPGHGRKRAMVRAHFAGRCGPPEPGRWPSNEYAWPQHGKKGEALIVGAGLAGAHTARELANRGWQVTVLEQAAAVATGASGNAQGAVYARLSHENSASNAFYAQALALAQHRLARLPAEVAHAQCGLLQLNQGDKEAKRFEHFHIANPFPDGFVECLTAEQTNATADAPLHTEALYFPKGGWVSPAELTAYCLNHPNIKVLTEHKVTQLTPCEAGWLVEAETQQGSVSVQSPVVVLTTAWESANLPQTAYLPVRPIAGQVTRVASRGRLKALKTVLCSDRYLVPAHEGQHCLGATFHLKQTDARHREEDDLDNLTALHARLPELMAAPEKAVTDITGSRAGIRCASPDYLPMVGPVLDPEAFTTEYQVPLQKRLTRRLPAPPWQPGLWVNIAHGSKGLCSIPLASKSLAAWLHGEPLPIPQRLANHLNPNRFLIRSMIRGKR